MLEANFDHLAFAFRWIKNIVRVFGVLVHMQTCMSFLWRKIIIIVDFRECEEIFGPLMALEYAGVAYGNVAAFHWPFNGCVVLTALRCIRTACLNSLLQHS